MYKHNKSALVLPSGYFGDTCFSLPIAERLISENIADVVDYAIGWPQLKPMFERNPYIRNVYVRETMGPHPYSSNKYGIYDSRFHLPNIDRKSIPTIQLQQFCGIVNCTPEFHITCDYDIDLKYSKTESEKRTIGIPSDWQPKSFQFTREEYWKAQDVPYLGYGGRLRNIPYIISELEKSYNVVMIGHNKIVNQFDVLATPSLDEIFSQLKYIDYFVGCEGGAANFAAGVGTKCIIESNFIVQLYGKFGVIQRNNNPFLGPHTMFPTGGHSLLNPYLSDDELINTIKNLIDTNTHYIFNWNEL